MIRVVSVLEPCSHTIALCGQKKRTSVQSVRRQDLSIVLGYRRRRNGINMLLPYWRPSSLHLVSVREEKKISRCHFQDLLLASSILGRCSHHHFPPHLLEVIAWPGREALSRVLSHSDLRRGTCLDNRLLRLGPSRILEPACTCTVIPRLVLPPALHTMRFRLLVHGHLAITSGLKMAAPARPPCPSRDLTCLASSPQRLHLAYGQTRNSLLRPLSKMTS